MSPVSTMPPVAPTGAAVATGPGAGDPAAAGFAQLIAGLLGAGTPSDAGPVVPAGPVVEEPAADGETGEGEDQEVTEADHPATAEVLPDPAAAVVATALAAAHGAPAPVTAAGTPGAAVPVDDAVEAADAPTTRSSPDTAEPAGAPATRTSEGDPAPVAPAAPAATTAPVQQPAPQLAQQPILQPTHQTVEQPAAAPVAGPQPSTPVTGPAPEAAVPARVPVTTQLAPEVTRMVSRGDGVHRLTMKLQPEALGEVRVTLTLRHGEVQVRLAAGDEAQRALIEGAPELRRILEMAGATEARVVVRDLAAGPTTPPTTGLPGHDATSHGGGDAQRSAGDAHGSDQGREGTPDQHARTRGGTNARDGLTDGSTSLRHEPARRDPHRGLDLTM